MAANYTSLNDFFSTVCKKIRLIFSGTEEGETFQRKYIPDKLNEVYQELESQKVLINEISAILDEKASGSSFNISYNENTKTLSINDNV